MLFRIFSVLVFLFGLSLIFFNNFWQKHFWWGFTRVSNLQESGSPKVARIVGGGIIFMILGVLGFLHTFGIV